MVSVSTGPKPTTQNLPRRRLASGLLRDAGGRPRRDRGRDQGGLPAARAQVAPGPQPRRQGGRGAVQGAVDRVRRALRRGEARALRPLRRRRRRRARSAPPTSPSATEFFDAIFGDLFGLAQPAQDRGARPALHAGGRLRGGGARLREGRSSSSGRRTAAPAAAPAPRGPAPGWHLRPLRRRGDHPQEGGLPHRAPRVPGVRRHRPGAARALRRLRGRGAGRSRADATACASPPGSTGGTTQRRAARGRARAARRPGGRPARHRARAAAPVLRARGRRVLTVELPLSSVEAALGTEVDVPVLDGRVQMRVPPGTQAGSVFRLRGRGFAARGRARGDAHVRIAVETPIDARRRGARAAGARGRAARRRGAAAAARLPRGARSRRGGRGGDGARPARPERAERADESRPSDDRRRRRAAARPSGSSCTRALPGDVPHDHDRGRDPTHADGDGGIDAHHRRAVVLGAAHADPAVPRARPLLRGALARRRRLAAVLHPAAALVRPRHDGRRDRDAPRDDRPQEADRHRRRRAARPGSSSRSR